MKTNLFNLVTEVALAMTVLVCQSHAAQASDVTGVYENRSETEFVYVLTLTKDGAATWNELGGEGGKSLVLKGKWQLNGDAVELVLPKEGKYIYKVQEKLSWENFGCKGASFGLSSEVIPKVSGKDARYDLWRKADLKRADKCTPSGK